MQGETCKVRKGRFPRGLLIVRIWDRRREALCRTKYLYSYNSTLLCAVFLEGRAAGEKHNPIALLRQWHGWFLVRANVIVR
jgi:hypothetical protein